jgi:hypothetical protein
MSDGTAPAVTGVHHFSVTVRDMDASMAWCQRVFRADRVPTTFSSNSAPSAGAASQAVRHADRPCRARRRQHQICVVYFFLVDPVRANRLWGDPDEPVPAARLLLRSMGYRDALIGGLLAGAALWGRDTRRWFLASGRADADAPAGGRDGLIARPTPHEVRRSDRRCRAGPADRSSRREGGGAVRCRAG